MDNDFKWLLLFCSVIMLGMFAAIGFAEHTKSKAKLAQASAICLSYEGSDWDVVRNICVTKKKD